MIRLIRNDVCEDAFDDLAVRFGMHRTTVMAHLNRAGVERRARIVD